MGGGMETAMASGAPTLTPDLWLGEAYCRNTSPPPLYLGFPEKNSLSFSSVPNKKPQPHISYEAMHYIR